MYVMTPEFGAASQLEKIDMLDFADVVAINKFERRGAEDAMRDVGRQLVRNREAFGKRPEDMPVFGTSAATFNDDGVTALYQHLRGLLAEHGLHLDDGTLPRVDVRHSSKIRQVVPPDRVRYLSEITETVRGYHARTASWSTGRAAAPARPVDRRRAGLRGSSDEALSRAESPELLDRPATQLDQELAEADRGLALRRRRSTPSTPAASPCPATGSRGSRCRRTPTTASW